MKKIPDPVHLSTNSSSLAFTSDSPVRNLGITLDPHLSFSNHVSNLSRSCFKHIRNLRCIPPMLDCKTVSAITTSFVHLKRYTANPSSSTLDPPKLSVCNLSETH